MKLPHTEVKFHPKVKSQTGLSSLRVSCKHPLSLLNHIVHKLVTSFRGLYGKRWDIMVQQVEGISAYSKHGLSDSKNGQLVLSVIGVYQKYIK